MTAYEFVRQEIKGGFFQHPTGWYGHRHGPFECVYADRPLVIIWYYGGVWWGEE